jgi:hypothetical protein
LGIELMSHQLNRFFALLKKDPFFSTAFPIPSNVQPSNVKPKDPRLGEIAAGWAPSIQGFVAKPSSVPTILAR